MRLIAGKYSISNGFGTKRPQKTAPKSTRSMVANHTLGNCYESSHTQPMTLRVSSSGLPAVWDLFCLFTLRQIYCGCSTFNLASYPMGYYASQFGATIVDEDPSKTGQTVTK